MRAGLGGRGPHTFLFLSIILLLARHRALDHWPHGGHNFGGEYNKSKGPQLHSFSVEFIDLNDLSLQTLIPEIISTILTLSVLFFSSFLLNSNLAQAVPMYLNEVAPTELRGSLGAVNQFGITLGILASYIVGLVVQQRRATVVGCSSIPGDATSSSSSSSSLVLYGKATDDLMCDDLVSGWSCEESDGGLDACEVWPRVSQHEEVARRCDYEIRHITLVIPFSFFVAFVYRWYMRPMCALQGTLPNWRVLAWVAAGASAFLCVAMSLMPESPVYLFKSGRSDRARRVSLQLGLNFSLEGLYAFQRIPPVFEPAESRFFVATECVRALLQHAISFVSSPHYSLDGLDAYLFLAHFTLFLVCTSCLGLLGNFHGP